MRILPISATRRTDYRERNDSRLRATILGMIASNSLAAFAQDISRSQAARPVRGPSPLEAGSGAGLAQAGGGAGAAQRSLEVVPPHPARPVPRGS